MLKAGLIGVGAMGRGHLDNYIRFNQEGDLIELVALCDIDPKRFTNYKNELNLNVGKAEYSFEDFHCYTDVDEMLEKEELDMVTIALPTYLHCDVSIKCLSHGIHVLCEKPMALNIKQCQKMIDAAKINDKKLMIGQCLHFWGEYEELKKIAQSGNYGKPLGAYFFRGGSTPMWSYENWLLDRTKGGGALFDQHIHDIDTINYVLGMPKAVSTLGTRHFETSGYDIVSTNYIFEYPIAVNAQDDWCLAGDGFFMRYRVNFEKCTAYFDFGKEFKVIDRDGNDITPPVDPENAYYKETKYFAEAIQSLTNLDRNTPESAMNTIKIALAETTSANQGGKIVAVE